MLDTFQSLLKDHLLYTEVFSKKVKHAQRVYPANHKIVAQGDSINNFYFIVSGTVRIVARKKYSSLEQSIKTNNVLGRLGPGELFGLFSLFDEAPTGADLFTDTDSMIVEIDKKSFLDFLRSEPDFGYEILYDVVCWLVQRLRQSNDQLIDVASRALLLQNNYRRKAA